MEFPLQFSEREKSVIDLLLQGKSNKQIALCLGVTNRTVEFHLGNIFTKMGVRSRSEVILKITTYNPDVHNRPSFDALRESTGVSAPETSDNGENLKLSWRIPMHKKLYLLMGLGLCLLIAIPVFFYLHPITPEKVSKNPEAVLLPVAAKVITSSPANTQEQALLIDSKYIFTQTVGTVPVNLSLNWFYIDSSRVNLEVTVCNLPVPDDFKPIFIINPAEISLYKADGSQIELAQHINFGGGGGGGEDKPSEEKISCFRQTFDLPLKKSHPGILQEDSYILDIPVGGSVTGETGEVKLIPSATFHLEVKPTYTGSLTFTTQKTADIEGKTVTFKGLEVNPSNASVILCVFDPKGSQWLPNVTLFYKGNLLSSSSGALVDGSSGNPDQEMCYRLNYSYSFNLETTSSPKTELFILVAKLTKDQPERLSYGLIAHAQNELAAEGIEFSYVIVNHGSNLLITKKPEGLTEAEALQKVQDSLTEDAVSSNNILIFDVK